MAKPERPLSEYRDDKRREVAAGYTAALTATLTMPAANPSAVEVATEAALLAAGDAAGLEYVQSILSARRDELFALVDGAASREDLERIEIAYPV